MDIRTKPKKTKETPTVEELSKGLIPMEAIAVAAYYRAERRGFAPGGEVDDWLEAERELIEALEQE